MTHSFAIGYPQLITVLAPSITPGNKETSAEAYMSGVLATFIWANGNAPISQISLHLLSRTCSPQVADTIYIISYPQISRRPLANWFFRT